MIMMNKKEIKSFAIKLLNDVELDDVESITVTENTYNDGSPYTEINIDYFVEGGED
jgi:hypothetical protein